MQRQKTYLNESEQWKQTVRYLNFLHRNKWMQWQHWLQLYAYRVRWFDAPALEGEALRAVWMRERDRGPRVEERDHLCLMHRSHRLVPAGDILVGTFNNGMDERYPIFGVSSKGARLSGYWLAVSSPYNRKRGFHEFVELPGDCIGMKWDDPAIGRFVVDLRASRRSRVGAGSPAP